MARPASVVISVAASVPALNVEVKLVGSVPIAASAVLIAATVPVRPVTSVASTAPALARPASVVISVAASVPVSVVTAEASTAPLVLPATNTTSAASADVSVTVIANTLFALTSVSVVNLARSPLEIVAVMIPVVSASMINN